MMAFRSKTLFVAAGWLSLGLGLIGAFLPVLPTTPFILLAAFFFSKGSPALHAWLLRQPRLGPLILDWQTHGVIRLRAKVLSTLTIVALFSYTLGFVPVPLAVKAVISTIGVCVLAFIWSRPSAPRGIPGPQPLAANLPAPLEPVFPNRGWLAKFFKQRKEKWGIFIP